MTKSRDIRRFFREVFPPALLLLVFTPFLVGLIINHELVNSREIIINLIWLQLFTIPAALLKSRGFFRFATILFFVLGIIEISHWIISGGPLTVTSILVISNSNMQEAVEFLNLKASFGLLILIPYIFLTVYVFRHPPHYRHFRLKPYLSVLLLLISMVFIFENALNGRLVRKGVPQMGKVVFSFAGQLDLYRELKKDIKPEKVDAETEIGAAGQTFVLILGESASRRHMSLYGYHRQTNPRLESRDDIIIFDNVVAPYSNTIQSVLSIMSESNLENYKTVDESIDLMDVFHSAGFETWWISNQPPMGIWENLVSVFASQADHLIFVNTTTNTSMEATLTTSWDSKVFEPFAEALESPAMNKFIVLHLMGSHSAYYKRYPSQFERFSGKGKVERTRAEYDNSRLYSDFIVDSLLTMLAGHAEVAGGRLATAVYLSDHGENV
ncbi:MAG: sulfatase-like hydrolase/transferase, partial [Bacteroidota bacterium]